jgi:dTMP kinase
MSAGRFVVFEGGEGTGKSTQAGLLAAAWASEGRDVVLTREPGGTALGARLRELLLDNDAVIDGRTEALLYAADRAHHVGEVIRPALQRGATVISDRFVASSLAYQGAGRALVQEEVAELSRFATGGLVPDLTVLLDLDSSSGLARAGQVGRPDRLEAEQISFHERVRERFLQLAAEGGSAWLVLDASQDPDALHRQVVQRLAGT